MRLGLQNKYFSHVDCSKFNNQNILLQKTHDFFRLIALCHSVVSEEVDGMYAVEQNKLIIIIIIYMAEVNYFFTVYFDLGDLEYQAQSPDEAALVTAARNFGFVFLVRANHSTIRE